MEIRAVTAQDIPTVHSLLKDFAAFQNVADSFVCTQENLEGALLAKNSPSHSFVGEVNGKIIAFTNFNIITGTFTGGFGALIEDLYITPDNRGNGYGTQLLQFIAEKSASMNCIFLTWQAYSDNQEAINFYHKIGAISHEMHDFILRGDALKNFMKDTKNA